MWEVYGSRERKREVSILFTVRELPEWPRPWTQSGHLHSINQNRWYARFIMRRPALWKAIISSSHQAVDHQIPLLYLGTCAHRLSMYWLYLHSPFANSDNHLVCKVWEKGWGYIGSICTGLLLSPLHFHVVSNVINFTWWKMLGSSNISFTSNAEYLNIHRSLTQIFLSTFAHNLCHDLWNSW